MSLVKWWICQGANGVHLQTLAICILSQMASSYSPERNWSTYGFIHLVKPDRLGLQNVEDRDLECSNLDISLAALNPVEPRSGIRNTSSILHFSVEHASGSIFHDEDDYWALPS
jgi:hypothetical protein